MLLLRKIRKLINNLQDIQREKFALLLFLMRKLTFLKLPLHYVLNRVLNRVLNSMPIVWNVLKSTWNDFQRIVMCI